MSTINIIWCDSTNKSISYTLVNIIQLTWFPIASKSLEANSGHFFPLCREHVLQEVFLQLLMLIKLTLMKVDKVVNIFKILTYSTLFFISWISQINLS